MFRTESCFMLLIRNTLIVLVIFYSSISYSDPLQKIEIEGLENISRGTLLNYLPIEVGDESKNIKLQEIIKNLKQTGFFSNVSAEYKDNSLFIKVLENPTIKFLEFKNFEDGLVLNDDVIQEIKKNFSLGIGNIYLKNELEELYKQLTNLYRMNGFYKIKITTKTEIDDQNRIGIEFIFDEGNQAKVKSINISGNTYFSEEDLLNQFDIGEADFFIINFFTEKDKFSKQKLEAGLSKLESMYLNEGFLDFKVLENKALYEIKDDSITINISLLEGARYKLKKFNFLGNLDDPLKDTLRDLILIKNGEYLDRKLLVKGVNSIAEYFQNKGYAFTKVNTRIAKLDSGGELEVDVLIDENIKTYINRIEIIGNNRTQDDVIRRNLKINEGQIYSKKEIDESIKQVRRLGFFSNVKYELKKSKNNPDVVSLLISVIETKTGEISIGLSHANSTGASINAGISQNNILGTGNTINAAISNSDAVKETSFYFKNPYINNEGHSLSYGLTSKTIDAENLEASTYSISEESFSLGYGLPVSYTSSIFAETKFSSIDLTCGNELKNLYEIEQCSSSDKLDSKIQFSYVSDSLNDFYFPSDGSKNIITTSISFPFSEFKYFQIEGSHRSYYPVLDDKTFKVSSRLNLAGGYGGQKLPFFKRYFEGGSSSVRGFDFNSLGSHYENGKPKGGEMSIVSSVALASSLNFLGLDNPNMKGAIFTDAGTISENLNDFDTSEIRASFGLQFTWITPIGPLGFNLSQPLIKKSSDNIESFSFELGTKF